MAKGLLQPANWRSRTLIASETALISGAVIVSVYFRIGSRDLTGVAASVLPKALLITCLCQMCLYYADLYDHRRVSSDYTQLIIRTLRALGATLIILALLYLVFPALIIAPGVVAPAAALAVAGVIAWRITFTWVTRQVGPRERLLLVGRSGAGLALAQELRERTELGVHIVGLVDVTAPQEELSELEYLGTIDDIPAIVRARSVDRVVLSLADARGKLPMDRLLDMKLNGVSFDYLASVYEEYTGKIAVENLRPSWLIFSPGFRKTWRLLAAKRAIDVAAALIGLVFAAPIILLLAVIVKATSPGPALYSQRRVGHNGRIFTVHKVRSMRVDAERDTGPVWAQRDGDARITPVGRFMRRTRLDELPQLWTILCGQMSLVGPRPERPEFVRSLVHQIPFYGQRHIVKPGLTGWAQVRYTYGASVEDALEKLQYDLFYIKHLSIAFDVIITFETIKTVLLRRGH